MRRDDSGFTLVELVITTTILGVVMSVLGTAFYVFFRTTGETAERLAESPALQIASTYLTRDAQSAQVFTSTCGSWPAGSSALASFGWRDPGATTGIADDRAVVVSYVVATGSNPWQKQLDRHECTQAMTTPGAAFPAAIASGTKTTVVAFVDPTPARAPVANTTGNPVTIAFSVCTAKTTAAECKSGSSVPFSLSVTRRPA